MGCGVAWEGAGGSCPLNRQRVGRDVHIYIYIIYVYIYIYIIMGKMRWASVVGSRPKLERNMRYSCPVVLIVGLHAR